MTAYVGLFATAFLAATVVPAYSEAVFASLLSAGYEPLSLWAWATAGNTLGAAVNWGLGRYMLQFEDRKWFPFKRDKLRQVQERFHWFGVWSLLFAWLPVGGDALTFVAGVMRVRFDLFLLLTGIGKGARYAVLLGVIEGLGAVIGQGG